jgi:hypothetical protein
MFDIYLCRFSKKPNSTARPDSETEQELQQVILKEGTSMDAPVFILSIQQPLY